MTLNEGSALPGQRGANTLPLWRAEAWRLWRTWRWYIAGAWVFLLAGVALAALPALAGSGPHAAKIVEGVLYPQLYHLTLQPPSLEVHPPVTLTGLTPISLGAGFVSIAFACTSVSLDRSRGRTQFALFGPVRRVHVWSVQTVFALLVPLIAMTVKALFLFALDAATGFAIPAHVLLEWWALNLLFDTVLTATALFVVAAVGQVLLAVVASVLLLILPMLAGGVLAGLAGAADPTVISINPPLSAARVAFLAAHPIFWAARGLVELAPVAHLGGTQGIGWSGHTQIIHLDTGVHLGLGLVVWLVVWALGFLWLAWWTMKTSKLEMWHEPMIRPRFALFIMIEFAAAFSYLIAEPLRMTVGAPFPLVFPAAFLLLGGLVYWLYRRVY